METPRIEPWEEPPDSYFPIHKIHRGETLGTKMVYEESVLRAHGPYSNDLAVALHLGARNHALIEGSL